KEDLPILANATRNSAAALRQRPRRSRLLEAQRELAGIGVVEQHPGALVEHVGVDAFRPQQRYAAFPSGTLGFERLELGAEFHDLLIQILSRAQPAVAGISVEAEIADHQRRDRVERERVEDGAQPLPGHHSATMPPPP